jgi:pseudouridine-5'-phosphate glycosidase
MNQGNLARFSLSPSVARARMNNQAVVALESTVIAHGLPAPHNLELARDCERMVREHNAEPATIGIVAGRTVIGLEDEQLSAMASRNDVVKVNLSNLAQVLIEQRWGATTVAASLCLAQRAGLRVFATGGIGGVHRGAKASFDISADLTALARFPLITVCAGAKAILDLPKTMEALETLGVPVVGYQTDELPAFYSRASGLALDLRADSPAQVAMLARTHWELGSTSAILVVNPVPAADEIPAPEIADEIEEALAAANEQHIAGKAVTPFLLARIADKTQGRSLQANLALLKNNARLAAEIACELT